MIAASIAGMLLAWSVMSVSHADYNSNEWRQMEQWKGNNQAEFLELLTDSEQEAFTTLQEEFKAELDELRGDETEKTEMSDDDKEELMTLVEAHQDEVRELLEDNDDALEAYEESLEARSQNMWSEKGEKGNGNSERWERGEKGEGDWERSSDKERTGNNKWTKMDSEDSTSTKSQLVKTYKKAYSTKLNTVLESVSDEKLEAILVKIETLVETYESNWTLTDTMAAKLQALTEIIEAKLSDEDDLDLESLFDF